MGGRPIRRTPKGELLNAKGKGRVALFLGNRKGVESRTFERRMGSNKKNDMPNKTQHRREICLSTCGGVTTGSNPVSRERDGKEREGGSCRADHGVGRQEMI